KKMAAPRRRQANRRPSSPLWCWFMLTALVLDRRLVRDLQRFAGSLLRGGGQLDSKADPAQLAAVGGNHEHRPVAHVRRADRLARMDLDWALAELQGDREYLAVAFAPHVLDHVPRLVALDRGEHGE